MYDPSMDSAAKTAASRYQGEFAWITVVAGIAIFASYVTVPFLVVLNMLPLWAGCVALVFATYFSYSILHDAVHGSISGSHTKLRWVNEWMGYSAAFVLMIPMTAHRHEHLTHHRNTNDRENDPDIIIGDMTKSPLHMVQAVGKVFQQQYAHYVTNRWSVSKPDQNLRFTLELAVAVSARVAFCAQGYWLEGLTMMVVGGLGGVALIMYLFAYLVHRPHDVVGRYVDTSTIIAPHWCDRWVTLFWMSQNYHSIHHLFPRVPFYRYRQLFQEIQPAMEANGAPVYALTLSGLQPRKPLLAQQTLS